MIVYGSTLSPYVRKVVAFAAEKGIELEVKQVAPGAEDPEFLAASPFRRIPGFRDGDFAISDSTAIITYLEALHPQPNLIPAEPRARARSIWYDEFADTIMMECGRALFFNRIVSPLFMGREGDLQAADLAEREKLPPILNHLERAMPESGFLVEDRITLADIAVASPFVNVTRHLGIVVDEARYPRTRAFLEAMLARPSFAPVIEKECRFIEKAREAMQARMPAAS
jgi:glutathione S-transferase